MKRHLFAIAIGLTFTLLLAGGVNAQHKKPKTAAAPVAAEPAPPPAPVPVTGMAVIVKMDDGPTLDGTTDSTGAYRVDHLGPGTYLLEIPLAKPAAPIAPKGKAKAKVIASYDSVASNMSKVKSPYGIDEVTADFTLKKVAGTAPASQATATTLRFEVTANQGAVSGRVMRMVEAVAPSGKAGKKKKN